MFELKCKIVFENKTEIFLENLPENILQKIQTNQAGQGIFIVSDTWINLAKVNYILIFENPLPVRE